MTRPAGYRAMPDKATEKDFQAQVIDLAKMLGWATLEDGGGNLTGLIYHPLLSRWSERGWPDLALARRRDHRFLLAELKAEKGKLTPRQTQVIGLLRACGVTCYVWRPSDLDDIAKVLA